MYAVRAQKRLEPDLHVRQLRLQRRRCVRGADHHERIHHCNRAKSQKVTAGHESGREVESDRVATPTLRGAADHDDAAPRLLPLPDPDWSGLRPLPPMAGRSA